MTEVTIDTSSFSALKDRVCVLTGGSSGIGEATVRLFHSIGAKVVFNDLHAERGNKLQNELGDNVKFVQGDVSKYDDVVTLFETALSTFGRVDVALSNAGIDECGDWFDASLTTSTIKQAPKTSTLDVNLIGTLFFARVAMPFLRHNARPDEDKNLILISSTAGFKEVPMMPSYQVSKHGVVGLLRTLRGYAPPRLNVRVNAVAPWSTETPLLDGYIDVWKKYNLPLNSAGDIAKVIAQIAVRKSLKGENLHVDAGRVWAMEQKLDMAQPQWLGEEASERLNKAHAEFGFRPWWSLE